jgi:autotransporter-associated beta strand protein
MKTHAHSLERLESRIAPATYRWTLTGPGVWNNAASWFNETTGLINDGFPNAVDDVAKLTTALTANSTVQIMGVNVIVGTLVFDDNNNYNVLGSSGGTLTFSSTTTASIVVTNANGSGGHNIAAPIIMATPLTIDQGSTANFGFTGSISDGGNALGITKIGTGNVNLSTVGGNTFTSTITINAGTLTATAAGSVSGSVVVGGAGNPATFINNNINIIADTASVTVNAMGVFSKAASSDTIAALTLNGGAVIFGGGAGNSLTVGALTMNGGMVQMNAGNTLTLAGDTAATSDAGGAAQILGGSLFLGSGGGQRNFAVADGPAAVDFTVTATVTASRTLVKAGLGTMQLGGTGANSTGGVIVNGGTLELAKSDGVNAFTNSLTIGDGLGGADADVLRLFNPNQIPDNIFVTINGSGLLDANGRSESISSISVIGGRVTTGSTPADLTLTNILQLNGGHLGVESSGSRVFLPPTVFGTAGGNGPSLIDGLGTLQLALAATNFSVNDGPEDVDLIIAVPINGLANQSLQKSGTGTLSLDASNTLLGSTEVAAGGLRVNGQIGSVFLNGGDGTSFSRLIGTGTIGALTSSDGAYFISPAGTSTGTLNTSSITGATNDIFTFDLNGPGPGESDRLAVTGTVNLTGVAPLNLRLNYLPNPGDSFTLITNDGADAVTGTFPGRPEGSLVFLGSVGFQISYTGGPGGNDVILTAISPLILEGDRQFEGQDDSFFVRLKPGDPSQLEAFFFGGQTQTVPVAGLSEIIFNGRGGSDTLTLDFSHGFFAPPNGITFRGGDGADLLTFDADAGLIADTLHQIGATTAAGSISLASTALASLSVAHSDVEQVVDGALAPSSGVSPMLGLTHEIRVSPSPGTASVQVDQGPLVRWPTAAGNLQITELTSVSHFFVDLSGPNTAFNAIIINGSNGDDRLTVAGSSSADTFTLAAGTLTTSTPALGARPAIQFSALAAIELLGASGDDTFILPGADFTAHVAGGPGLDTISFAGASNGVTVDLDRLAAVQAVHGNGGHLSLGDATEAFVGSGFNDVFYTRAAGLGRSLNGGAGIDALIFDAAGTDAVNVSGSIVATGFAPLQTSGLESVRLLNTPVNAGLGSPGNTFASALDFSVGKGPLSAAAADLNGDGRADFVTADSKSHTVSIVLSTGTGLFLPAVQMTTGGKKPTGVVLADFDGVNGPDIAVTNAATGNLGVLLNDGAGGFAGAAVFVTGKTPTVLRTANLDGDSDPDLVALIAGNKAVVLANNGSGSFTAAAAFATGSVVPKDLGVADLDGDNDQDLVILHAGGRVVVHKNNGLATFTAQPFTFAGIGATALALGDFNNDGFTDAAVTHNTTRVLSILLGQANAAFLPMLKIVYPARLKAAALVASDFDGDGFSDLAIANGVGGRVSILRSLGNGAFATGLEFALDDTPPRKLASLLLGDFDGDGRVDLGAVSSAANEVSLLLRA